MKKKKIQEVAEKTHSKASRDTDSLTVEELLAKVTPVDIHLRESLVDKKTHAEIYRATDTLAESFKKTPLSPFPTNVTSFDSKELGKVYQSFAGWAGYMRYVLNMKEAEIIACNGHLRSVRRVLYKEYEKTLKKPERKDKIDHHDSVIALEKLLAEFEAERQYLQAGYYYLDGCTKSLSREISRRGLEVPR